MWLGILIVFIFLCGVFIGYHIGWNYPLELKDKE